MTPRVIVLKTRKLFADTGGSRADAVTDQGDGTATQHQYAHDHLFKSNYLLVGQGALGTTTNTQIKGMRLQVDALNANITGGLHESGVNDAGEADFYGFQTFGLFNMSVSGSQTHRIEVYEVGTIGSWKAYDGSVYVFSEVGQEPQSPALQTVHESSITVSWTPVVAWNGYSLEASTAADFSGGLPFALAGSSAASSLSVESLDANTTYYLRVGSRLKQSDTNYSVSLTTSTLAKKVSGTDVKDVFRTSATITWVPRLANPLSESSEGYVLQASTSPVFLGTVRSSATPAVGLSTLTVSGLRMQTTYYFRVGSLNHNQAPQFASAVSTYTLGFSAPVNPAYAGVFLSSMSASWGVPPPPTVDAYRVEASTASDFTGDIVSSQTPNAALTALSVYTPGLDANTTYYLRVGTVLEDTTNYVVLSGTSTLAQPAAGAAFLSVLSSAATVGWGRRPAVPLLDSAEGYLLETSTAPDFTGTVFSSATPNIAQSTLTIQGLASQVTYYFRVGTLNHQGVPNFAAAISSVTTDFLPPGSPSAYATFTASVTVSWTAVPASAVDGYLLEASLAENFGAIAASSSTANPAMTGLSVPNAAGLTANTTYYLRAASVRGAQRAYAIHFATSTHANAVSGTAVLNVFITSATIGWTAMPGAPQSSTGEGYILEASASPDFLGTVRSSATPDYLASTLTVTGLQAGAVYYFRAGSLNWNGSSNFTGTPVPSAATGSGASASQAGIDWRYAADDSVMNKTGSSFSTYLSLTPGAGTWLILSAWEAGIDSTARTYYSRLAVDTGVQAQDIRFDHEPPVSNTAVYRTHAAATVRTLGASDVLRIQIASEDNTNVRIQRGRITAIPIGHLSEGSDWSWSGIRVPDTDQSASFETINQGGAEEASAALAVSAGDKVLVLAAGAAVTAGAAGDRTEWRMEVSGGGLGSVVYDVRSWEAGTNNPADRMPYFSARVFDATADGTLSAYLQHRGVVNTTFDAEEARVILVKASELFGDSGGGRADSTLDSGAEADPVWAVQHDEVYAHDFQSNYLVVGQGAVGTSLNTDRTQMQLVVDQGNSNIIAGEFDNGVSDTAEADMELFTALGLYNIPGGNLTHRIQVSKVVATNQWRAYDGSVYVFSEVGIAPKALALSAVFQSSANASWTPVHARDGFVLEASTAANFGGILRSSATPEDGVAGLEVSALDANTTYYFRVGSKLELSDTNYSAAAATITLSVPPGNLAVPFPAVWQSSITAAWAALPAGPLSASASGYHLEASSTDFSAAGTVVSSRTLDISVSTLTVWSPALDANTRWYFRAAGLNQVGTRGAFTTLGSTSTLAKPPAALPAANTYLQVFQSSITVAWAARPLSPQRESAEGYRLEASTAADFTGVLHSSQTAAVRSSTLTVLAPALEPNTTYYFRAASLNLDGSVGFFTALGSTVTLAVPPAALPVAETFLGVFRTSVTVAWAARPESPPAASSETASGYLLQASTAADFTGLIASSRTFAVLESTLTVASLDPDTTYYFRAASLNRHRVTGYFTVLGATSTVANAPGALAQSGTFLEVHETSMTAAWVAHPLSPPAQTCQGYRLEASSTGFNGAGVVISSDTPNVGLSTLTVLAPALWANTTYYLRVAAFNHNGVLSEFTALASTATLAPSPSAKPQTATFLEVFETSMTAAWVALPAGPEAASAEGYRLEASSTDFDGAGVVVSSLTPNVALSTLTVFIPELDRNTTYYLRVAALNHNRVPGHWTALYSTATLATSVLGSEALAMHETSATIRWAALPAQPRKESAEGYRLEASLSAGFSGAVVSSQTPNVALSTLTAFSAALAANTTYYFRVAALNPDGVRSYGAVFSSSTWALPPAAETQANTFPGVFRTSVTVVWQARAGGPMSDSCEGYRLEASSTDFGGSGLVYTARSATYLDNTLTVTGLDANTTYYFRAASLNHGGVAGNFTALYATATLAGAPSALPAGQRFLMVGVSSATAAWVAAPASPMAASAEGYVLYASSTDFGAAAPGGVLVSSWTFDRRVSTLTAWSPALEGDTTYYFRVAGLNHNGVPGDFTSLGSTVTLAAGPAAGVPPFLGVWESSVTAAWIARQGGGYRVEASSTDFGALLPGGVTVSSTTFDWRASTLTAFSPALAANT
ncbi:MAG TPA: hypothetical protein DD417_01505, partial [Elusimicrobia bacterium]|nr:hypothetical protein [Elusimicrobiota bacterium]